MRTTRANIRMLTSGLLCMALVFGTTTEGSAQSWQALGPDDQDWPSLGRSAELGIGAHGNGQIALAYNDYCNGDKLTVMSGGPSGNWSVVGTPGISAGHISGPNVEFDLADRPIVAFRDVGVGGRARVIRWDGSTWNDVGGPSISDGSATGVSMALDALGNPYVAYRDVPNGFGATVKHWDGTMWNDIGIEGFSTGSVTGSVIIKLTSAGDPIVTYEDDITGAETRLWNGTTWTLLGTMLPGVETSFWMVLDPSDRPVVCYRDATVSGKGSVQRWDGTAWNQVGVPGELSTGVVGYIEMVVDDSGNPVVDFRDDGVSGGFVAVRWDGASWVTISTPGLSFGEAVSTRMTKDDLGAIFMAYSDDGMAGKSVVLEVLGTTSQVVGSKGFSEGYAGYTSMDLDQNGDPVVLYRDETQSGKASVNRWNGIAWDLVGTAGFSDGAIDHPDVVVDATGNIYVAYSDISHSFAITVKLFNGSSWVNLGVPNFSDGLTNFISMDLDAGGSPVVSYRDYAHGDGVTVERWNGTSWVAVGSKGFSSGISNYTSLAMDASDDPVVAFVDGSVGNKASVMRWNGGSWSYVGLPGISTGAVKHTSLRIDNTGNLYVAYQELTGTNEATVLRWDGTAWSAVGPTGFTGSDGAEFTSLALDPSGKPVIAFSTLTPDCGRVGVMRWNGSTWTHVGSSPYAAEVNTEEPTSWLEIDDSGNMTIAYASGYMYARQFSVAAPCTDYTLEFQNDANPEPVTWEILNETGTTILQSGTDMFPGNGIGTQTICLPDGCYQLRVSDPAGDGLLGYVLRETGANGRRIIDNTGNMSMGASQITNGGTFCVPVGSVELIYSSCDKLDWVQYKYLVCHADPLVAAEWIPSGANNVQDANSGYEFWIFDPNGSYSFRKFHPHNESQGFSPATQNRACHLKIHGWYNTALTPHIPEGVMMNVRVRGRVNGTNQAFGPACTMMMDAAAAFCPLAKLQDDPAFASDYSCGVTRQFGGTNTAANKIVARPPQFWPAPYGGGTGVRYQFRFRIPAEGVCIVRPAQYSAILHLNWSDGPLLEATKTYEVEVRVSKDQGATWCIDSPSPACDPSPVTTWGKTCNVTISGVVMMDGGSSSIQAERNGALTMYPNPNNGEQLFLQLSEVAPGVHTMSVDIFDLMGKRVTARTVRVQDGFVNTVLDLNNELSNGLYMVNITAGEKTNTERLVIQK